MVKGSPTQVTPSDVWANGPGERVDVSREVELAGHDLGVDLRMLLVEEGRVPAQHRLT